ncbi:hypothetical protein SUS17_2564 [Sphingomonas sp. S17]|uniref:DNA, contig: SP601 n=1 Tax=Sphingomonas paucimobilis NBRC 13935 TaxID=1219050 RepID=A0A0C9NAZ2_SPHPI|nr:hypothetical protein SUS17_2564 [Sphingomonas sp. S17]BCI70926.1 hypothetical protein SPKIRA_17560 [Sphingomonas paucimobilis]GAN11933.1 hypothetical protein SP6_01_00120 [Sphingomonas paucimobilis NBRC 13935]
MSLSITNVGDAGCDIVCGTGAAAAKAMPQMAAHAVAAMRAPLMPASSRSVTPCQGSMERD